MSQARSREPLEGISKHDRTGYNRGCGCDECTAANTEYMAGRRGEEAARREQARDTRNVAVPVRLNAQDNPVTVRLSPREADVLDGRPASRSEYVRDLLHRHGITGRAALGRHAEDLGVNRSQFIRDLLLAELGIEDTARRPAQRRPNYKQRGDTGQ